MTATSQAGVRLAQQQQPDLILLATNLADRHGFVVLRMLKSHPKTQHIPVIAVSPPASIDEPESSLRTGFDGYIAKPVMKNELYRVVEHVWQQTSQTRNGNP